MVETGLWCLSRLGARKLFYGPINQVLPLSAATRWMEALLKIPNAQDALIAIARRTGDSTRDLAPATLELVRRKIPEALIPALEGEMEEDLGKVFGEELPSGLGGCRVVTEDQIVRKLRRFAPLIGDDCAVIRPASESRPAVHNRLQHRRRRISSGTPAQKRSAIARWRAA